MLVGRGTAGRFAPIILALLVLVVGVVLGGVDSAFKSRLQNLVFDTYQRIDPRAPLEDSPVVILDIDDETLRKIGQWPWPRNYLAIITRQLQDAGAAAIVYDVLFTEPDRTSPARVLEQLGDEARAALAGIDLRDNDAVFAEVMRRGRVVIGLTLSSDRTLGEIPPPPETFGITTSEPAAQTYLSRMDGIIRPIPELEAAAAGLGSINFVPDADGVVRMVPLLATYDGRGIASLAVEALRVAQGETTYRFKTIGGSGETISKGTSGIVRMGIGPMVFPTETNGHIRIHYAHVGNETVVPIWRLVAGEVSPDLFAGRIVLVGASATGLRDLRFNTLGEQVPGVFMHAQMIDQILSERFLVRLDYADGVETILKILVSILLILVVMKFGAIWSGILGASLISAGVGLSLYAFLEWRYLFDPLLPSTTALAVFLVCAMARYWQAEREQRFVKNAFKTFVSPNLVDSLALHPEALKLGGARKECTFLFSDLAGFTSFVEQSPPEVAVPLLNEYLDNIVRIGLKHGGYLDKIVGDATVFHFNAFLPPMDQPDHAQRAYDCAREMTEWSQAFSALKRAEGIPLNETRIGVNTGWVTMGNFGGAIFDYTAHGDAINTAARLESAGKFLGVHTSIAGATVEKLDGFMGRPCGTLVLKGQTVGTPVFEPLSENRLNTPAIRAYLTAYALMEREDPRALEAMEAVLQLDPADGLAKLHAGRLAGGARGVKIVMTSK
jgi:adenylate cyclase